MRFCNSTASALTVADLLLVLAVRVLAQERDADSNPEVLEPAMAREGLADRTALLVDALVYQLLLQRCS